jgi:hypothetical protein
VVSVASPLLRKFSRDISNKEQSIQVALIEAAEMVFLLGPTASCAPDVLLELPHVEFLLEECGVSISFRLFRVSNV